MLRESGDPVEIPDEALCLIGACEVRVRHDERADGVGLDEELRRRAGGQRG